MLHSIVVPTLESELACAVGCAANLSCNATKRPDVDDDAGFLSSKMRQEGTSRIDGAK